MVFKLNYIICSAIWFDDGKEYPHQPKNITTGYVVTGRRHHNCFMTHTILKGEKSEKGIEPIQGFISSNDLFLDRKQASEFAFNACQIDSDDGKLFSEDLY